ncbi:RDD family protein [Spirochaetia bacterium]|nr:RDD family protein [Spirochaetia bacterium]
MDCGADSSLAVQTPEGIEFILYPAGLPIRMCAAVIDSCVQWIIIITLFVVSYLLDFESIFGTWILLIMIFLVDWFYHVTCELCWRGQSPGKKILGIRVVRGDGSPVNPGSSFLRNLLRFADTFLFLYIIVLLCISVSRGFRRLGDWAADTLVVYTSQAQAPVRRSAMPWLQAVELVNPPRRLSYEEKQAILMFARRYPLLGKERADEIAHDYTEILRGEGGIENAPLPQEQDDSGYLLGIARGLSGDGL